MSLSVTDNNLAYAKPAELHDIMRKIKTTLYLLWQFYGCELWDLFNSTISTVCVAWRKALKRVWNLPLSTHSDFLFELSNVLPVFNVICKRVLSYLLFLRAGCSTCGYLIMSLSVTDNNLAYAKPAELHDIMRKIITTLYLLWHNNHAKIHEFTT